MVEATTSAWISELVTVDDDLDAFQAQAIKFRWSDGLPLIPPTTERVQAMLAGTDRDPVSVLGAMPPSYFDCTIEKIAIAAVMAGCLPEYMPVVIAIIEAALEPQ